MNKQEVNKYGEEIDRAYNELASEGGCVELLINGQKKYVDPKNLFTEYPSGSDSISYRNGQLNLKKYLEKF